MRIISLLPAIALAVGVPLAALAHGPKGHEHKNLLVLEVEHKALDKGMKDLAKGLGVKCTSCHVKGKFDLDDVETKAETRKFLETTIGEQDAVKRAAALRELLDLMKIEKPKNEAVIWSAIDSWKKKPKKPSPLGRATPARQHQVTTSVVAADDLTRSPCRDRHPCACAPARRS